MFITKDKDFASRSLVASRCPVILWLLVVRSQTKATAKLIDPAKMFYRIQLEPQP